MSEESNLAPGGGAAGKIALVVALVALLGVGGLGYMNFQLKRENTLLRAQVEDLSRRVDRLNDALDTTTKMLAMAQTMAAQFKDAVKEGGGLAQLFAGGDGDGGGGGGADFSNAGSALSNLMKAFSGLGQGDGDGGAPPMPGLPGLAPTDDSPPGPGPKVSRAEAKALFSDPDKLRCGRAEPSAEPLGLKLLRVRAGSICDVLGLRPGDIITEAEGLPIATPSGVKRLLDLWRGDLEGGKQSFGYKFIRDDKTYDSALTISE